MKPTLKPDDGTPITWAELGESKEMALSPSVVHSIRVAIADSLNHKYGRSGYDNLWFLAGFFAVATPDRFGVPR